MGRRISAAPVGLAGCRISVAPSSPGGCRISAAPLNLGPQKFCGTSQIEAAEFLRHHSIWGRRISATPVSLGCRISGAPVSLGVQNFCGTSQFQAAEPVSLGVQNFCDTSKLCGVPFRIFSASGKRNKSKVSYVIQNLLVTSKFLFVSYILALFC